MNKNNVCKKCGRKIPKTLNFCSEECEKKYKSEHKKGSSGDTYIMELNYLTDEYKGREIELELARGRNVKGKIIGFDNRFGKIAIESYENKRKVVHIVKLSYIVSFHIYD